MIEPSPSVKPSVLRKKRSRVGTRQRGTRSCKTIKRNAEASSGFTRSPASVALACLLVPPRARRLQVYVFTSIGADLYCLS